MLTDETAGAAELPAPDETDRARALAALVEDESGWSAPGLAISLDDETNWKPDLKKSQRLLHLSLTGELPKAFSRRMRAAIEAGYSITFATTSAAIDIDVLLELQSLDARIYTLDLDPPDARVRRLRSVADFIAVQRAFLDPDSLRALAGARLADAMTTDHSQKKGRWFEEVLCLLFSQVSWLTVDEHAYNNSTEEIDLVLSCRAVSGYIVGLVGGPIIVATAKNESKATNSQTVKYLKEQMANRKGRCKLGFLCSASTISDEAKGEILRGSQSGDAVIACLAKSDIDLLIAEADRLDEHAEELIRKAIAD